MAPQRNSKIYRERMKKTTFRRNDKKSFHRSQSTLSTTLAHRSTKPGRNVSIISSLKANNKQLAAALDEAKQTVRRGKECILKLQQERQELLERNAKSERCIQSLQSSLPKAEQLLHEAGMKIAESKESIVQAKELASECSIRESTSGKSVFNTTSSNFGVAVNIDQPIRFDPVLASTPQNSPSAAKGIDLACSMFEDAFQDELSISLTEVQNSGFSTLLSQDVADELSDDRHKVTKEVTSLPVRTPRPKRHCTELTTSYAEDELVKKFCGNDLEALSSDVLASKQRKSQLKLKKKSAPALRNITNVI